MVATAFVQFARKLRSGLLATCAVWVLLHPTSGSAESEYSVKAAYLVNFAKLVDWPASVFSSSGGKLVVGVVGRGAAADVIVQTLDGASAGGRALEIRRVSAGDATALAACHLVFVLDSERTDVVLGNVQGQPVLTVGEADDFARKGGAIRFVRDGGTVKFEANPKAAARNGVTVGAKLLRVARSIVN